MSECTITSSTQRIIVDPFSSSVAVLNAGPIGKTGTKGEIGPPNADGTYVKDSTLSSTLAPIISRITALEPVNVDSWVTPTLLNGFETYPGWQAPRIRKQHNMVFVEGLVRATNNPPVGSAIFTLPVGYRPLGAHLFACYSNHTLARINILPNGNVIWQLGSLTQLSLSNIVFGIT